MALHSPIAELVLKKTAKLALCLFSVSLLQVEAIELVQDEVKVLEGVEVDKLENIKHPLKPFLWKVEKEGFDGSAWLFGTVHLSDPRVTTLHPLAQEAYDKADRVYTEVNLSIEGQFKAVKVFARKDGKTLSESLGRELTKRVDDELMAIAPGSSIDLFNPMKTWVLAVLLPQISEQLGAFKPLDMHLWERSVKQQKSVIALETYEEQTGGLSGLTEKEQIFLLRETVKLMKIARKAEKKVSNSILNMYLTGDDETAVKVLNKELFNNNYSPEFKEKLLNALLFERNKRIAEKIDKYISQYGKKSHFFAVGTAHYFKDKNIIQFLKKKGYKITRINK